MKQTNKHSISGRVSFSWVPSVPPMKDMQDSVVSIHTCSAQGKYKFSLPPPPDSCPAPCLLWFTLLKAVTIISVPLVAISATILLAFLSSLCCWLALQAFFGHPSSVSNIRPGWPNFILYWIPPVWIHTHTDRDWEPETSACTCPSALRDSRGSSASWWATCTQRPSQAATSVTNSFEYKTYHLSGL